MESQVKQVQLTDKDLLLIKDLALFEWNDKAIKDDSHLCRCYLAAFIQHLKNNNLTCKDGKIYEQSDTNS